MCFGSSDSASGRIKNVQKCFPNPKAHQHLTTIADNPLHSREGEAYVASLIKVHNPHMEIAVTSNCDVVYDHIFSSLYDTYQWQHTLELHIHRCP